MRAILAVALSLAALGWLAAGWNSGQPRQTTPPTAWRRTAQGWEALPVREQKPRPPARGGLEPVSVAALQVLAIVLLLAAEDRRSIAMAKESCTDSPAPGH